MAMAGCFAIFFCSLFLLHVCILTHDIWERDTFLQMCIFIKYSMLYEINFFLSSEGYSITCVRKFFNVRSYCSFIL